MKDATSSKNFGRFGPVLVRPGRFDLILAVVRFRFKGELFRLWGGLVHFQSGAVWTMEYGIRIEKAAYDINETVGYR